MIMTITRLFNVSGIITCCKLDCSDSAGFAVDGLPHCLKHMLHMAKFHPWQAK